MRQMSEGSQAGNDQPALMTFESLLFELLERGNQAGYEAYSAGQLTAAELKDIYRHLACVSAHGEQLLQKLH